MAFSLLRRAGSNHRPSGYEPDELPLLYSAIYIPFRNRLQRYYKKCKYANFLRKKCVFVSKKCIFAAFSERNFGKIAPEGRIFFQDSAVLIPAAAASSTFVYAFMSGAIYNLLTFS